MFGAHVPTKPRSMGVGRYTLMTFTPHCKGDRGACAPNATDCFRLRLVGFGGTPPLGVHAADFDAGSLRHLQYAASPISPELQRRVLEWLPECDVVQFYGMTEAAPTVTRLSRADHDTRPSSMGVVVPGVQAQVRAPAGEVGELWVRGPNVMAGYLKAEQPGLLQPPVSELGEGWYETGDVVEIDDEGFVRIVGRVKRFAKIAGEMVSLEVVEKLAVATSPAQVHAVSSQPDAAKGEALVLFTTDGALGREALAAKARELGLPELAVPRKIQKVEALPLLGTGKIDYVMLKQMAAAA